MDNQKLKLPLPPSRIGKKQFCGYLDPSIIKELKMLAVQTGESVQSLLNEALVDLLAKYKNKLS